MFRSASRLDTARDEETGRLKMAVCRSEKATPQQERLCSSMAALLCSTSRVLKADPKEPLASLTHPLQPRLKMR